MVSWFLQLVSRVRGFFGQKAVDCEFEDEMQTHVQLLRDRFIDQGMPPEDAAVAARRQFGNLAVLQEQQRETRTFLSPGILVQDVRYALRQLRKSPGFTLTAVLTLAFGIGANTAIFTLVHAILLRSLPVADPSRLYRIGDLNDCCYFDGFENDNGDFDLFPYDLYLYLKQSAPEFEQLAAVQAGGSSYSVRSGSSPAKPLRAEYVSGNYFTTLGVGAYAGRPLLDIDDKPGAAPALVLSYQTWKADFGGEPGMVGSTIHVQTHPFTIAGIAPPGFYGDRVVSRPPDFWVPLANEPMIEGAGSSLESQGEEDTAWLYLLGRVRSETNIMSLQTKLSGALRLWMASRPAFNAHGGAALIPRQHVVLAPGGGGIQKLQQYAGKGLRMLMILSSVVLLIACANIANLLLARGTTRRAEVAVRMALGAARKRIIRQILTECVLLSTIGGIAGLAVAYGLSRMILILAFPEARNMPVQSSPSLAVLGFAFLVSLLTGVIFGAAPAWLSSQAKPAEALRGANRSTRDSSSLPQRALVVLQVAMSVVLLAGALLMTESLARLEHQKFGVATANRYVVQFDPQGAGYTVDRLPGLYRQIEGRLSALPAASNVSLARYTPLDGNAWGTCVIQQGHPAPGPNDKCFSSWVRVGTKFLDSVGVPILLGRNFSAQDTQTSTPVVLVNQSFAQHFFPNQSPIGKHFGIVSPKNSGAFEIAGVFADFKMSDPRGEVTPLFLRPLAQQYAGYTDPEAISSEKSSMFVGSIIIQFTRPQQDAEAMVRRTLADIDPNLTVFHFVSYDSQVADNFNQDRLIARLTSLFGILALILASVGLYGVMSYFVARRTSEVGIRMALGATRWSVISLVLRGALGQILAGLCLGVPAALYAGHLMTSFLYSVSGFAPFAFVGSTLILGICGTIAGFIPAQRAASIDPMRALRTE
jgi:macrolide transport system ATP-binding/permease protein